MRRRDLLVLLGGATATWRRPARAQQRPIPVVGFLSPRTIEPGFDSTVGAFRRGLRELGYVEGRDISLEIRSSDGENKRLPALAAELAALKPDVIVTEPPPNWWTPLVSSEGSRKVSNGRGTSSVYG